MSVAEPRLRADAQRNLARVLEAAREVFAEHGLDASVTMIAERAGVGTATIFRRFPTKEALLTAVVEQRLEGMLELTRHATSSSDPAKAFRTFMRAATESFVADRGFCECAGTEVFGESHVAALLDELNRLLGEIVRRAQDVGEVRRDVTEQDIPPLVMAIAQAGASLEHVAPGSWRRQLDIVLDGLRPEGARPLSRKPLTRKQVEMARTSR
jgi:AcrR family transcriptional regulator